MYLDYFNLTKFHSKHTPEWCAAQRASAVAGGELNFRLRKLRK